MTGLRPRSSANAFGALCIPTHRNASPSDRYIVPNCASQIRVAFSRMALKTGSSSPGVLEITFKTDDVAVCCSSDSERSSVRWRSSLSSRVFSMAMTAWAAKVFSSAICCSLPPVAHALLLVRQ